MEVRGNTGGGLMSFSQGLQCVGYFELSLITEGTMDGVGEVISW